jgi:hypothetical protein
MGLTFSDILCRITLGRGCENGPRGGSRTHKLAVCKTGAFPVCLARKNPAARGAMFPRGHVQQDMVAGVGFEPTMLAYETNILDR